MTAQTGDSASLSEWWGRPRREEELPEFTVCPHTFWGARCLPSAQGQRLQRLEGPL